MKYICPICEKTFFSKEELLSHNDCKFGSKERLSIIKGYLLDLETK